MLNEEQVGNILLEWDDAWEQGRELSAKELCQEFPDLIEEVQQGILELRKTDWLEKPIDDDEDDDI